MPKISSKGQRMPSSPIRKLIPFAEQAENSGKSVYYLNIGQPDIETPISAQRAIKEANIPILAYSHSAGFKSLREGLVRYYADKKLPISIEEVIVTTGGSEALLFAFGSTMDVDDEIIIPEPFYANYNGFAMSAGVNVVPVTSTIEEGFSLPPISEIENKITKKTKAIVICNPGNPTGYVYSEEELMKLRDLVLKHNLFLIADEVYREFCYDGAKPMSVMQLDGLEQNVLMIDSVSKRYSMCGARIGALVSKNKAVIAAALKFGQARLSPPTIDQIACEAALDTPQSYFDGVQTEYVERRNIMVNGLNSIPGVFCPMPKGAFYCVAKFPVDNAEKFCQWLLEEYSFEGQTVMMAPANGFYSSKHLGLQEARIAYVLKKKSLLKSLVVIRNALKVYPGITDIEENKNLSKEKPQHDQH